MTTRAIGSRLRASVRRTNGRPTVWLDESGGPGMKHGAAFNVRSVTEWPHLFYWLRGLVSLGFMPLRACLRPALGALVLAAALAWHFVVYRCNRPWWGK